VEFSVVSQLKKTQPHIMQMSRENFVRGKCMGWNVCGFVGSEIFWGFPQRKCTGECFGEYLG